MITSEVFICMQGTIQTGAKFDLRFAGIPFACFFKLIEEPKYNTFRWTLDYQYASDFEDNVGLWVVSKHPNKQGWSRVSYSTKMNVFPWVPKLVTNLIVKSALTDSTKWIVREAEMVAKSLAQTPQLSNTILPNFVSYVCTSYQQPFPSAFSDISTFLYTKKVQVLAALSNISQYFRLL